MKRRATRADVADRWRSDVPRRVILGARDDELRARLARALRRRRYEVIELRHAVEITRHLMETSLDPAGRDADVLISDVTIPGASALEVLEYLRALDPATHLILLVDGVEPRARAAAGRLGATLLEPPLEPRRLLRAVQEALGERSRRDVATRAASGGPGEERRLAAR